LLIVELKIRKCDETLSIFNSVDFDKELIEGLLHESVFFANHCMSLTGASLAVYKNTRIIAFEEIVQKFIADVVEDFRLGDRRQKYFIKSELMFVKFDLCFSVCE
jgi:hypothetical protein